MRRLLDIDQLLIFALLAVTVNQMGHYLAGFAPPGLRWIGYCQAVAIDAAIWRSAYWFRRYGGRKQRHWSLAGVVLFSLVSAWYNRNYYAAAAADAAADAAATAAWAAEREWLFAHFLEIVEEGE